VRVESNLGKTLSWDFGNYYYYLILLLGLGGWNPIFLLHFIKAETFLILLRFQLAPIY